MGSAMLMITLGTDYDAVRAATVKARLTRFTGVKFVDFIYTNNKLTVKFDPDQISLSKLETIVAREKKHRAGLSQGRVEQKLTTSESA